MPGVFLTAEWRKLVMANYAVDPVVLRPFLPARTELDYWQGETYVSLVGFEFLDVRVKRLRFPFHRRFPEVNLRFYVRHKADGEWKRGVVFVREIVPLPAVSIIANTLFRERYICLPMRSEVTKAQELKVAYAWKYKRRWNQLAVEFNDRPGSLTPGSKEEFITEHFWGYAKAGTGHTNEYQVAHPRWEIYQVTRHTIDCDFAALYGASFADLSNRNPQSVFLAEGSPIEVFSKAAI
jgi:uncharacterized protein YqjF (DUF2071 family)